MASSLTLREFSGLLSRLPASTLPGPGGAGRVAVALSGGADSTALTVLLTDYLKAKGVAPGDWLFPLIVDHSSRPDSASDAQFAARQARELGLHPVVIKLDPGIAESAPKSRVTRVLRDARVQYLAEAAKRAGARAIFYGHHSDDQAETVLMRMLHKSGLYGLTGMHAFRREDEDGNGHPVAQAHEAAGPEAAPAAGPPPSGPGSLMIVRPLLGVTKGRLEATCKERGIAWAIDSSNEVPFTLRNATRLALGSTEADVRRSLTAALLAVSSEAEQAHLAFRDTEDDWLAANVRILSGVASCAIDQAALVELPETLAIRALERVVRCVGGGSHNIPLRVSSAVLDDLRLGPDEFRSNRLPEFNHSGGGCIMFLYDGWLYVMGAQMNQRERELITFEGRFSKVLEGRLVVERKLEMDEPGPIYLSSMRKAGVSQCDGHKDLVKRRRLFPLPHSVQLQLPAIVAKGGHLLSVPHLAWSHPNSKNAYKIHFCPVNMTLPHLKKTVP